jgi:excisionase family DNA binding protein
MQSRTFFAQFIAALARDTPAYTATVSQPSRSFYRRGYYRRSGQYVRGHEVSQEPGSTARDTPAASRLESVRSPEQETETGARERPRSEVRFLTVAETAAVMRVSKMTVYRLVHSGELPAIRVGRSFRVPEAVVHDYLRDVFVEGA